MHFFVYFSMQKVHYLLKMNERYKMNSKLIRQWLRKEHRKLTYLQSKLDCSSSLVANMLGEEAHVPSKDILESLAAIMGVEVGKLLLPRETQQAS
jgi:hypothetical protein